MNATADPVFRYSLSWRDGAISAIDQRRLPHTVDILRIEDVDTLIEAIVSLAIRGAPALGLAGAFGVAISARAHGQTDGIDEHAVRSDAARLTRARPTAVNLSWGVARALGQLPGGFDAVLGEGMRMLADDEAANTAAAARAADLVTALVPGTPIRVLTHCNTGLLAAVGGTALGAVLELARRGLIAEVLVDETRPLLQGSRLTAWELAQAGLPYRICVDAAAGYAMARGLVDCVMVGADRIAANGDTANKIGTYGLAVLAEKHGIPFVIVAPESTCDPAAADGTAIRVEERDAAEVLSLAGTRIAPAGARAFNPAFDVTPGNLISAIVTEARTVRPRELRLVSGGAGPRPVSEGAGPAGEELARLSRDLYARGWMPGTSGNLSVRLPGADGDRALITASGRDKGELGAADTVAVDVETGARLRPDGPRASAETPIHTAIYRSTPARAVIHVHAPWSTVVARRAQAAQLPATVSLDRFELLKGLGLDGRGTTELPVFRNWPDVGRIASEIAQHLRQSPAGPPGLLIADHGITVWGTDLAQARNRLECFESICQLIILADSRLTTTPMKGRDHDAAPDYA